MTSRRLRIWLCCLLPFLVAQMLVPTGFMPQFGDGRAALVWCGLHGDTYQSRALPESLQKLLDKKQGTETSNHCLFSQAAAPALAWLPASWSPSQPQLIALQPQFALAVPAAGVASAHRARGPPALI